jgi:hypothetical protein
LIARGLTCLLKAEKLTGSTEVDPKRKVKVKCVNGSPIETDGLVEAELRLRSSLLPHKFQLVNEQVEIPCDGILGRDFLVSANARICYESRTVTLKPRSHVPVFARP